jgi:ATP-dependent Clp endopeptidase proteolytic subunit ClpP
MNQQIKIKNEVDCSIIDIEGTIGVEESWQFENPESRVATYERFRECVARIADIRNSEIRVNIRSTGGDVNDAILIYEALRATGAKVTTCCYGYTASAATIVAQAASEGCRYMASSSLYLIHNSICSTEGNASELQAEVEMLEQTDRRLAEIYASRSGCSVEEIAELMNENGGRGRWLSPSEAIAAGLVDAVIEESEKPQTVIERAKRGVKAFLRNIGVESGAESVEEESATPGAVANHTRCGARAEHLIYVSLRALQSGQKGASSSQVKSVQDLDLLDIKHDPRTMAYEEDARKIRLR